MSRTSRTRHPKGSANSKGGQFAATARPDDPSIAPESLASADSQINKCVEATLPSGMTIALEQYGTVWMPGPSFETSSFGASLLTASLETGDDIRTHQKSVAASIIWAQVVADMLNAKDILPGDVPQMVRWFGRHTTPVAPVAHPAREWSTDELPLVICMAGVRYRQVVADVRRRKNPQVEQQILDVTGAPRLAESNDQHQRLWIERLPAHDWIDTPKVMSDSLLSHADRVFTPNSYTFRSLTEAMQTMGVGTKCRDLTMPARLHDLLASQMNDQERADRWDGTTYGAWPAMVLMSKAHQLADHEQMCEWLKADCPSVLPTDLYRQILQATFGHGESASTQRAARKVVQALASVPKARHLRILKSASVAQRQIENATDTERGRASMKERIESLLGTTIADWPADV